MKSLLSSPLPLADWPPGDRLAWERAVAGDPLAAEGGGGGAVWRESTKLRNRLGYGGWLAWLKGEGLLEVDQVATDRVTRERVRAYLVAMEDVGLADHTRAGRLQTFADALRVMHPEANLSFISRAAGRISRHAKRARDLRPRLRPPVEVLEFGLRLMREAEEGAFHRAVDRAYLFRDGLLIALWVHRPLRIANLAAIELERHLVKGSRLQFEADEMKGARHFSCAWPERLSSALRCYLEVHRPVLLSRRKKGGSENALWISRYGGRMPPASVGQIIRLRTQTRFGETLNPHLMRYLTATFLAEHEPERIADVAAILHHASLETSEQHYILANSLSAVGKFQEALLSRDRAIGGTGLAAASDVCPTSPTIV